MYFCWVVLFNPSILLLDELIGGLDFDAERAIQEVIDLLMLGRSQEGRPHSYQITN